MFGLGFFEIVIILGLMILIIPPRQLPGLMRRIGQVFGQLQRMYYAIVDELNVAGEKDEYENHRNRKT